MENFRLLNSLGDLVAEIEASSAEEAWDLFVSSAKATLDVRWEPHVERYEVREGGLVHLRTWLIIDQDEPPCSSDEGHAWEDEAAWSHGDRVVFVTHCTRCGRQRVRDGAAQILATGDLIPRGKEVVRYI